ncbi:hypothetical protein BC943DRAFT_326630 [Umbelopsis sp. AD052]|nr:hypothetical protein BC943DRAFT_326630 [Umbelopsis sp. AD052]
MPAKQSNSQRLSDICKPLSWFFPDLDEPSLQLLQKFNILNLLLVYCVPLFYIFYPALLLPAICFRSLSFLVSKLWAKMSEANIIRDEDTAEYMGGDDMNFWLQRCSICLDSKFSLFLDSCRDQFCADCFARYIEESVNSSWGLSVKKIHCPVCQECIPQSEWAKFVSPALVEKYNAFNQPYRPFSRFCQDCDNELVACRHENSNRMCRETRFQVIRDMIDRTLDLCASPCLTVTTTTVAMLSRFQRDRKSGQSYRNGCVKEMHHYVISGLLACIETRDQHSCSTCGYFDKQQAHQLAANISRQFVSMEIVPEYWKSLQFAHIAYFPDVTCTTCDRATCLRCGAFSHPGMTCRENLQFNLSISETSDELDTIKWKFENSRCCPSCSIMIHRDEGCNKVDCSLCGYRFCWACLSAWSEKCGFYQCGYQQDQPASDVAQEAKAELGVPDVLTIERRYSTSTTSSNPVN